MDQAYYYAVGTSRGRLPAVPLAGDTPQRYIFRRPSAIVVWATVVGVAGRPRNSFWYQLLMPAAAGTRRYEKPELWFGTANWHGGFCHAPPRPQRGTSPRATFSHSAMDHRTTIRQDSPVESGQRG